MKAMRPVVLLLIAVIAAVIGWLATLTTNRFSMPTPVLPVSALITMARHRRADADHGHPCAALAQRQEEEHAQSDPGGKDVDSGPGLRLRRDFASWLACGDRGGSSPYGGLRGGEGVLWTALSDGWRWRGDGCRRSRGGAVLPDPTRGSRWWYRRTGNPSRRN